MVVKEAFMSKVDLRISRIVCFMDVLGFKDLVNEMGENGKNLEKYQLIKDALIDSDKLLKEISEKTSVQYPQQTTQTSQFSDSIVITCPVNKYEKGVSELTVIMSAYSIMLHFMMKGIFIRGGIAKDWCHHEGNVLFGKGMLDAYYLESKMAFYPRIIVDDEIVNNIPEHYSYIKYDFLKLDLDGYWYINAFNYSSIISLIRTRGDDIYITKNALNNLRRHINNKLEESRDKGSKIKKKNLWLAKNFNNFLNEHKNDPLVHDLISDIEPIEYKKSIINRITGYLKSIL